MVAYAILCLFIPGSLLTIGAGFAFGLAWGTVAVSVGSVACATIALLLGRTLIRKSIEEKVETNPKFQAIDRAVEQNGFKITTWCARRHSGRLRSCRPTMILAMQ